MLTDLLESLLTSWGHEPVVFNKSIEALTAMARDDAPQLALLDWNMPFVDGLGICQSIRRREGNCTYIILLTGNVSKQHVLKALAAGANDYVVKPFRPDHLRARIDAGVQAIECKAAA